METTWHIERLKKYPKLAGDITCDVAIIGGGLVGVLSAYQLSKAGKKVVLLEAETLGSGATMMTTAFITREIDTNFSHLVQMFGPEVARLVWESGDAAIDEIAQIVATEKIDCDFMRCSAHLYATSENELQLLKEDQQAAEKQGFQTLLREAAKLPFPNYGSLEIPNQAKFHPIKFLHAVAKKAVDAGAEIYEHSEVAKVSSEHTPILKTKGGTVSAKHDIVATYHPINNPWPVKFKKGMYKSFLMELRLPKGKVPEGLYWDQRSPYNYFRVDAGAKSDRMVIGGQDHRKEIKMKESKNFAALKDYFEELFPDVKYMLMRSWAGPVLEPGDGLPFIGSVAPHHLLATAFSGNGMTYAMISALLFEDIILGTPNPWRAVYNPKRAVFPNVKALWQKGKDYSSALVHGAVKNAIKYRGR